MIDFIQKQLDPPGLEKKNRGAVFWTIGTIFSLVRKDAVTAFNAHFPYLADPQKLTEHAKALGIPRFPHDTDDEFRERVAAASFFHMKAGERGYITERLTDRFHERLHIREDFLQLFLEILDFADDDRTWVFSFLDAIIDPNVSIKYIAREKTIYELIRPAEHDVCMTVYVKTLVDSLRKRAKYDGKYKYNKKITHNYYEPYSDPLKLTIHNKSPAFQYNGLFKHDGCIQYRQPTNEEVIL